MDTAYRLLSMIPHSTKLSPNVLRKIWEVTLEREARREWHWVMSELLHTVTKLSLVERHGTMTTSVYVAISTRVTTRRQGVLHYTTTRTCLVKEVEGSDLVDPLDEDLESYPRSGCGDIHDVMFWIGTHHLDRDLLHAVQAYAYDAGTSLMPLPLSLYMTGAELIYRDLSLFLPSEPARRGGESQETILAMMELDSQTLQGQVALQLLKYFC